MATQKLYPLNTDTFSTDEITVVDHTSAVNKPSLTYNKFIQLIRFDTTAYRDDSQYANDLDPKTSLVELVDDAELGKKVAHFDNLDSLQSKAGTTIVQSSPLNDSVFHAKFKWKSVATGDDTIIEAVLNGCHFRFLLTSANLIYGQYYHTAGNFFVAPSTITRDTWHTFTVKISVDTGAGTITLKNWFDGAYVGSNSISASPETTHDKIYIGAEDSDANKLNGYLSDVCVVEGVLTDEECLDLNINGPTKYLTQSIYTFERDFTDAQLTAFLTFAEQKTGSGSLGYNVSIDNGVTWLRWSGTEWTSTGSGYNTATTLNDSVSSLTATGQDLRLKVALISDGWQSVGFEYFQLGYEVNSAPTVICGASKFGNINEQIYAFNGSTVSDVDSNLSQVFYKFDFEAGETEILKGAYATFQDAVDNKQVDLTGFTLGEVGYYLRGLDSLGAETICYGTIYVLNDLNTKLDNIQASIDALNNFDPATDTVAHVTLVDTTTTNTDMISSADITAIKAKTDQLTFTGTDVKATLDGETVTTDTASREASKADVSALATQASLDVVDANIDTIQLRVEDSHDFFFGNFTLAADGHAIWYKKDGTTVLLEKLTKSNGVASDTDLTSREEWV